MPEKHGSCEVLEGEDGAAQLPEASAAVGGT